MRSDWRRPAEFSLPGEGERRIKLRIAYDGSEYHGWQSQGNAISVQSVLSGILSSILSKETTVYASGRTDAGVHALCQVCHFDTLSSIEPHKWRVILNTKLPKSIRVLSSEEAPSGFHARFTTMSREYWYLAKCGTDMLPWDDKHVMPLPSIPDMELLNAYASCIFGTHDFTVFASARDPSESKVRDIYVSRWDMYRDSFGYPVYRYITAGNAFLYHQVRSMVGTMIAYAMKGRSPEDFRMLLESRDRSCVERTAPPDGLYLADVSYDEGKYQWFEDEYGRKDS